MGKGLGQDPTICVDTFVEAMRHTLPEDERTKVDRPEVRASLRPLGEAVYEIATGPAQTRAEPDTDARFWAWVAELSRWAAATHAWQRELLEMLAASERDQAERGRGRDALRSRLRELAPPPEPPTEAPASLTGRIR